MDKELSTAIERPHRISLPDYTLGEEIFNAISHGAGALLGIAALVLCVVKAAVYGDAWAVVSSAVYGSTLIILYTISTLYHALARNRAKRVFRVIDHCSVYLLIAGTYTPYTLVSLRGPLGWTIFGIVWAAAIVSIVFNCIDLRKYRVISFISCILMGWAIILATVPLRNAIGSAGVTLLLIGGAAYSAGSVLYLKGKRHRYMHSAFHLFVVAGSVLHFLSIYLYVL